jgi:Amt family ammonium transporter
MAIRRILSVIVLACLLALSSKAAETKIDTGDTAWILASAALVLFMTPGVGLFYGGMVREKNVLSIITQSFIIIALVSIQWILIGYSLSFGPDVGGVIGSLKWAGLSEVGFEPNPDYAGTIPHSAFMIFQAMFAIITPALVIGAFADRMKFSTFIVFTLLWATLVYDPIAHWIWGVGGFLRELGALDFAGGTVVHISAGVSALAAAMVIGRRIEYRNGNYLRPHNITMSILGAAILWFGWFGFNAGSALGAGGLAANAFVVTNTAAAAAALSWMLVNWIHTGRPSSLGIVTGAVCGLVAITPASGYVNATAAILIGAAAGIVCYLSVLFTKTKTALDDSLDVASCHGVGGIAGAILTGVFAEKAINSAGADGLLAGNPSQLVAQTVAVVVTIVYAFIGTVVILKILEAVLGLRVKREEEVVGLDLTQHGEEAYPDMEIPN